MGEWNFLLALAAVGAVLALLWRPFRGKAVLRISSWGDQQENEVLIGLIAEFQERNPGVQVVLNRIGFSKYVQTNLEETAAGIGPDVIFTEMGNFPYFHDAGVLEPLNAYAKADKLDLGDYYREMVDFFSVRGETFAIPRDAGPVCAVYYNKAAFREAGVPFPRDDWDWGEFLEAAKKLTTVTPRGKVLRWGVVEQWMMPAAWVYSVGGSYVDNPKHPTRWTFATDSLTAAGVKFRADLINIHKVMPSPTVEREVEGTQTWYMFVNGTAAMYISGIWKTAYFRETVKDFPWDVTLMPQGTGGQRRFAMGGSAYGVSKSSKNKKLAWKLVRFLTGEEGLGKLAATGVAHPARVKVAESPDFLDGKDPQNKKVMLGTIPYGRIPPMCLNWQEAQVMINAELEDVWRGKATVEEAMARLRPQLEANPPITSKR